MDKLSKTERILAQKPREVVDASVLFGAVDKNPEVRKMCARYIGAMGHKYQGFTTIPLLGEMILAITKSNDQDFRSKAYYYVDRLLLEKLLHIIPIQKDRDSRISDVCKIDKYIKEDDATHLSNAICSNHTIFVTLDESLVGKSADKTRQRLKQECGLGIFHPRERIERLNI